MQIHLFFSLIIALSTAVLPLSAQRVVGAELEKKDFHPDIGKLDIKVQVCRAEPPAEFIVFDWGDGQVDTIPTHSTLNAGGGYIFDLYFANHYYSIDTSRYVELKLHAGRISDGFTNVDYTVDTDFILTDSFYIHSEAYSPHLGMPENFGPRMELGGPVEYTGAGWDENLQMYQMPPEIDLLEFYLGEYPVAGYIYPAAEYELYVEEGGLMRWEYPQAPGMYAIAGKVRELKYTDNPLYTEQWFMVSTITKAFPLFVDSTYLVSTLSAVKGDSIIGLYPNPASTTATLEYAGATADLELNVMDARGRIVLRKSLPATDRVQHETLDVSSWPAGIYWVEISSERGRVTKKLVVE